MATRTAHRTRRAVAALVGVAAFLLGGCGSDTNGVNDADREFLAQMIPHHQRAIEVARVGVTRATDPRVRAFAARIVREQTPELTRMQDAADGDTLDLVAGAREARHRISDTQLAQLQTLRGVAFDRRFLALHIASETGAAEMAQQEVHAGRDDDAVSVAKGIATAPTTQIPELRRLLTAVS